MCRNTTRQSWFILSGSGSKVDPLDGHDGYTILRLPERKTSKLLDAEGARTEAEEENGSRHFERQRDYVVWDHVGALDGRV